MHLCVQPAEFGWFAADMDSLDADCDGQYGQYAHGNTRQEALFGLRDFYTEVFAEGPTKAISVEDAKTALAWIDSRLHDEDQPKPKDDKWFELAKEIVGA